MVFRFCRRGPPHSPFAICHPCLFESLQRHTLATLHYIHPKAPKTAKTPTQASKPPKPPGELWTPHSRRGSRREGDIDRDGDATRVARRQRRRGGSSGRRGGEDGGDSAVGCGDSRRERRSTGLGHGEGMDCIASARRRGGSVGRASLTATEHCAEIEEPHDVARRVPCGVGRYEVISA
jgi:hypothetical protein